jgi:hypothetical protein
MAEFMNEQLTKSKRGRKPKPTADLHFESDLTSTSSTTNRTEAELQAEAIRLHDVPRDQWPDDVLTYQREQQRLKKRKDREMQAEDDRLRRQVEQQRRQELLDKIAADEPEEESRQPRQRSIEYNNRTKRQRQSEVDSANAVPADLMTDDEIEAARTAPLAAPNEELKQYIVNRTRAALSDANRRHSTRHNNVRQLARNSARRNAQLQRCDANLLASKPAAERVSGAADQEDVHYEAQQRQQEPDGQAHAVPARANQRHHGPQGSRPVVGSRHRHEVARSEDGLAVPDDGLRHAEPCAHARWPLHHATAHQSRLRVLRAASE